jgi:LDH2 family malate/lactate/ureidoglycolate dehydrogenase
LTARSHELAHTDLSFDSEQLRGWSNDLLAARGMSREHAGLVTESLLYAEHRGVATHGFVRLPTYIRRLRAGGIAAHGSPRIRPQSQAVVVVDGEAAAGAVVGAATADGAAECAATCRIGAAVARDSNHFGCAGFYAERIADRGFIGMVVGNSDAIMAPPGGGGRVLGSNPLAIALPVEIDGVRPVLDMATTEAAYGRLLLAAEAGASIPEGWAVDGEGRPTTDPEVGLKGALLPASGPKGFGLAFMIDVLATLAGADLSPRAGALYGDEAAPQRLGIFALAVDPRFDGIDTDFGDRLATLMRAVRQSGRNDGPIPMIPGEPEARRRQVSGAVTVSSATFQALSGLSAEEGVDVPTPAASA